MPKETVTSKIVICEECGEILPMVAEPGFDKEGNKLPVVMTQHTSKVTGIECSASGRDPEIFVIWTDGKDYELIVGKATMDPPITPEEITQYDAKIARLISGH